MWMMLSERSPSAEVMKRLTPSMFQVPSSFEHRAGAVHPDRGVGAEHHLADRPLERRRGRRTAELGERAQPPVLGVHPGAVALLERLGDRGGVGLGVEDGGRAVGLLERRGEVLPGQPVDLGEDLAGGGDVDVGEGPGAEHLVGAEDLEEVELDVAEVALVVAHLPTCSRRLVVRPRQRSRVESMATHQ
jgi:hypothetical protein